MFATSTLQWINKPQIVSHSERYKVLRVALILQVTGRLCFLFPFLFPAIKCWPAASVFTAIEPLSWGNILTKRIHALCLSLVKLFKAFQHLYPVKSGYLSKIEQPLSLSVPVWMENRESFEDILMLWEKSEIIRKRQHNCVAIFIGWGFWERTARPRRATANAELRLDLKTVSGAHSTHHTAHGTHQTEHGTQHTAQSKVYSTKCTAHTKQHTVHSAQCTSQQSTAWQSRQRKEREDAHDPTHFADLL